jgi:hypothetical protein
MGVVDRGTSLGSTHKYKRIVDMIASLIIRSWLITWYDAVLYEQFNQTLYVLLENVGRTLERFDRWTGQSFERKEI